MFVAHCGCHPKANMHSTVYEYVLRVYELRGWITRSVGAARAQSSIEDDQAAKQLIFLGLDAQTASLADILAAHRN